MKKLFVKISQYSQETPVLESLFNKVDFKVDFKMSLQHRCFAVNIAKFLRTPILKSIGKRLLLYHVRVSPNCYPDEVIVARHCCFQKHTETPNYSDKQLHISGKQKPVTFVVIKCFSKLI